MEKAKSTKLGARIWVSILFFGLAGQLAWVIENMYFIFSKALNPASQA